jgi:hypothetical protein
MALFASFVLLCLGVMTAALLAAPRVASPWAARAVWALLGVAVLAACGLAVDLAVNPSLYRALFG